ncbi:MAG: hypothetical protein NTW87_04205 [Planctomycetota bacterium]|nr:hypothetical protein [Planctomycetota bacterium]
MLYRANYTDGSAELLDAPDIRKARAMAQKLYDVSVKNVVVQDDVDETDLDDEEEDGEQDEEQDEEEKGKKRR